MKRLFFLFTFLFLLITCLHSQPLMNASIPLTFHESNTNNQVLLARDITKYYYPSRFFVSTFFFQQKDSDDKLSSINPLENISFGIAIYSNKKAEIANNKVDHIICGITLENSVSDFRRDGFEPISDSILISNAQFFTRIYNKKGLFVGLLLPINHIVSIERTRMLIGFSYKILNNIDIDIDMSYRFLLEPNKDGFRKGMLTLGVSRRINIKL